LGGTQEVRKQGLIAAFAGAGLIVSGAADAQKLARESGGQKLQN